MATRTTTDELRADRVAGRTPGANGEPDVDLGATPVIAGDSDLVAGFHGP